MQGSFRVVVYLDGGQSFAGIDAAYRGPDRGTLDAQKGDHIFLLHHGRPESYIFIDNLEFVERLHCVLKLFVELFVKIELGLCFKLVTHKTKLQRYTVRVESSIGGRIGPELLDVACLNNNDITIAFPETQRTIWLEAFGGAGERIVKRANRDPFARIVT